MGNIVEVREASEKFLKTALNVKDAKVIKAVRVSDGWETEAEVYEESSFIKALGLPTRVQDRNIYEVKLDENLEVLSYEKQDKIMTAE